MDFYLRIDLTTSWWEFSLLLKIGTSSCITLKILMSILLKYSLNVLELEAEKPLSLVIGLLPPISDSRRLTLRSFVTTLSLLTNCKIVFLFLGKVVVTWESICYPNSSGFFFQFKSEKEFMWPGFNDLVVFVVPLLFIVAPLFCWAGCILLEAFFGLLYFFIVDELSSSADGPSVLILRSLNKSGVKVFLPTVTCFFFNPFLSPFCLLSTVFLPPYTGLLFSFIYMSQFPVECE